MDRLGSRLLQRATYAKSSETKEEVAIKKIGNAFDNRIDAEGNQTFIVKIKDIIWPPDKEKFNDHVYIVYELMDIDLHQIIRSSHLLTDDHCQVSDVSGIRKRSSLPWRQLSVLIEDFEDYVENELSLAEFSDIFDMDHFKEALADDVRIISSLPSNHLMLRLVEEKHTPLRVSPQ
ncbi:hypothetical protein L6452_31493 [Arctium lappa]|uniref:Uncharacterized protein n=1 Tax=Arctium lappa TaxID=4217 RepID=A0ACB8Z2U4_ARCLA|nr:hypothetical protein L6452_31493 [Arctium lappa]